MLSRGSRTEEYGRFFLSAKEGGRRRKGKRDREAMRGRKTVRDGERKRGIERELEREHRNAIHCTYTHL